MDKNNTLWLILVLIPMATSYLYQNLGVGIMIDFVILIVYSIYNNKNNKKNEINN